MFVLTFDGFSQIFGQLFGKTPILTKISPNKTWEGFFGGFLAVLLTAFLYYSNQENYQTFPGSFYKSRIQKVVNKLFL